MNTAEKIAALFSHGGKHIEVIRRKRKKRFLRSTKIVHETVCWLTLEDKGTHWAVYQTSHRDYHYLLWPGGYIIDVSKADGQRRPTAGSPTGVWKTTLSVWPERDLQQALAIFAKVVAKINLAYDYYCVAIESEPQANANQSAATQPQ